MRIELQTARLQLRPCRLADAQALHRLWTKEGVRRFLFDDRLISAEQARDFANHSLANFGARGYGLWLIFGRGREDLVGFAGFVPADDGVPHLLYGIDPEYAGRGYATEAGRAVLDYVCKDLGITCVKADVDEPNVESVRVLEKLGLKRVGRAVVKGKPLLYYELSAPPGAV